MLMNHTENHPTTFGRAGPSLQVRAAGYSVTGTRHVANQDRFLADQAGGMFLVADGMGGMRAGERAAQLAVDLLPIQPALVACAEQDGESIRQAIEQSFLDVNDQIVAMADSNPKLRGMGTTAVMALIVGSRAYIANLGDSRAYLLRDGELVRYTVDHNMAQTLVNMGAISRDMARTHQWRHMLLKYLGLPGLVDGPDVSTVHLQAGDRLLLTTDGATGALRRQDIVTVMQCRKTAEQAAEGLVRAAVAAGTHDDATCIVIDIDNDLGGFAQPATSPRSTQPA